MGQNLTKVFTVSDDCSNVRSSTHFTSLQDAIDNSYPGCTILIDGGEHELSNITSSIHIIGLNGAKILPSNLGESFDVTFENIIFENCDNVGLLFKDCRGYVFKNCEFYITLNGCKQECVFGVNFVSSSALFQNPIFCIDVEDLDIFVALGASCSTGYLSLQSPIIRINYRDVNKCDTYFFRGSDDKQYPPYIESFSASIHYRNMKRTSKCKKSNIRLFRGLNQVNSFMNNTRIHFVEGKGKFNIAAGDSYIYINGLTASSDNPDDWEIGSFRNILLTSFQSNLTSSCDINEFTCVEPKKYKTFSTCNKCSAYPCYCDNNDSLPTPLPEPLPCP